VNPYSILDNQRVPGFGGGVNPEIPPGVNLPYGYPSFSAIDRARNAANSGFAPASSIATGNPMFDTMINLMMSSFNGGRPMLGTFKRPTVSDYQQTSMQERYRVFDLAKPSLLAANPMLAELGDIGQNRLFQEFMDQYTPGGSMTDAFGVVMGNFTENMAGPGIRNAEANAIHAANIVRNVSNGMSDKDGQWDYFKSHGFNRAETFQNMAAFNKKFGGYVGEITDRSQQAKDNNLSKLAGEVLKRPSLPYGPTPQRVQEIDQARKDHARAQNILSNQTLDIPTPKVNVTEPVKLARDVIERADREGKLTVEDKDEISKYSEALNAINTLNQQNTENVKNTENQENITNTENVTNTTNTTNATNKTDKVEEIIKKIDERVGVNTPEMPETPVEIDDTPKLDTTINQVQKIIEKHGTKQEIETFNNQKETILKQSKRSVDITEPSKLVRDVLSRADQEGRITEQDANKIQEESPKIINAISKVPGTQPRVSTESRNKATSTLDQLSNIVEKFGTDDEKTKFKQELQKISKTDKILVNDSIAEKEKIQKNESDRLSEINSNFSSEIEQLSTEEKKQDFRQKVQELTGSNLKAIDKKIDSDFSGIIDEIEQPEKKEEFRQKLRKVAFSDKGKLKEEKSSTETPRIENEFSDIIGKIQEPEKKKQFIESVKKISESKTNEMDSNINKTISETPQILETPKEEQQQIKDRFKKFAESSASEKSSNSEDIYNQSKYHEKEFADIINNLPEEQKQQFSQKIQGLTEFGSNNIQEQERKIKESFPEIIEKLDTQEKKQNFVSKVQDIQNYEQNKTSQQKYSDTGGLDLIGELDSPKEKQEFSQKMQEIDRQSPAQKSEGFSSKLNPFREKEVKQIDITAPTALAKNAVDRARKNNIISERDEKDLSYYSDANEAINTLSSMEESQKEKDRNSRVNVAPGQDLDSHLSEYEVAIKKYGTPEEQKTFEEQKNKIIESTTVDLTDTAKLVKQVMQRKSELPKDDKAKQEKAKEAEKLVKQLDETGTVTRRNDESLVKTIDDVSEVVNSIGTEQEKKEFAKQSSSVKKKLGIQESNSTISSEKEIDISDPTKLVRGIVERADKEGRIGNKEREEISSYTEAVDALTKAKKQEETKTKTDTDKKSSNVSVTGEEKLRATLDQFSKIALKLGTENEVRQLRQQSDTIVRENNDKVEQARNTEKNIIEKFGSEKDIKEAKKITENIPSSGLQSLSETRTPQNAKEQDKQVEDISELNSMVREAQNVFGSDTGLGELMDRVGDLVEGASGMSTGKVRDLLQKIQATAVVVDMSNEAIARYFEVTNEMYKGMGVKGGNHTNMAQNALIAAKGVTDARKKEAQAKGEMYTGESTEEMAVKIAEYQGRVARSSENQDLAAALATLGTEGEEGRVGQEMKQAMDAGDFKKAREIKEQAISSGRISKNTELMMSIRSAEYEKNGGVSENDYKLIQSKYGMDGDYFKNLTGENYEFVRKQVYGNIADTILGSRNDSIYASTIEETGVGKEGTAKLREAISDGKITQEDITDDKKLKQKISEILPTANQEQIQQIAGTIGTASNQGNVVDQFKVAGSEEAMKEIANINRERAEVDAEVKHVNETRGPLLRDFNIGEKAMGVMSKVYKDLKKEGNEDGQISFESVVRSAKGQLGDYDKMTAKEKEIGEAQLDLVTGKGGKLVEMHSTAKQEAHEEAVKEVAKIEKSGTKLSEETKKKYTEEYENKIFEEKKSKIAEELENGKVKLQGEEAEKEKKNDFDPKNALDRILTALEGIAGKLGVETNKASSKSSTGGAESKTENNGSWWNPFDPRPK